MADRVPTRRRLRVEVVVHVEDREVHRTNLLQCLRGHVLFEKAPDGCRSTRCWLNSLRARLRVEHPVAHVRIALLGRCLIIHSRRPGHVCALGQSRSVPARAPCATLDCQRRHASDPACLRRSARARRTRSSTNATRAETIYLPRSSTC